MATTPDINSKRTRVEPIFGWLRDHGNSGWPGDLLGLADGLNVRIETGELESLSFEEEVQVAASPTRLAWMIRNAERLAPVDGKRWRELHARVIDEPERERTVTSFERGELKRLPASMTLEGPSSRASVTTGSRPARPRTLLATKSRATSRPLGRSQRRRARTTASSSTTSTR